MKKPVNFGKNSARNLRVRFEGLGGVAQVVELLPTKPKDLS
jgi:hypothetical protein